jgi:hypothetical protein
MKQRAAIKFCERLKQTAIETFKYIKVRTMKDVY